MPVPESFGHQGAFKVVSELGRGGFATVYKAYQASLDRYVAIKVLRAEVVQDDVGIQRFQREARAAARLGGHPNIVTIYDYGEQDGMAYLALEFIDGSTLQERLAQPISAAEIDRIISGVASALDYAHQHQLVHRDVKPSNVLIGKDGRVVLSDFGIAKLLDAATSLTGAAIGTPEYMAPEQITGAQVDARSDIYSLGVMVYRVFAGKPPFQGPLMSVLHRHVHEPPPQMSAGGRRIPPGVDEVVLKALAKDPARRYPTAGALGEALSEVLRAAVLAERARAALGAGDLDRADRLAAQVLADNPEDQEGRYVRHEVVRRRQLAVANAAVARLLDAGDWRAALAEIDRLRLREYGDPAGLELVRRADEAAHIEAARIEAERRAEAQRQRHEREARERAEREARERAELDRLAREARERDERERQERQASERAERERQQQLAQARAEQERREREARTQAERERLARERAEREARDREARRRKETIALEPPRPKIPAPVIWLSAAALVVLLGGGAVAGVTGMFDPSPATPTVQPTVAPTPTSRDIARGAVTPPSTAAPKPTAAPAAATLPPTAAPKPAEAPTTAPVAKPTEPAPQPKPTVAPQPKPTTSTGSGQAEPPAVAALPQRVTGRDGAELALVAAGGFFMGSDTDQSATPLHKLDLPDFYVDVLEVTNALFLSFVQQASFRPQGDWRRYFDSDQIDKQLYEADRRQHPVVNVTVGDATAYCAWAGKRLPFEVEWEKAARGSDGRRWPWGNEPHPELANVETRDESGREPDTMKVGSFPRGASPTGALDMAGNVWEWTASPLLPYPLEPSTMFASPPNATASRVTRGASWLSLPERMEVTSRLAEPPNKVSKDLGFRCAMSADQVSRR